MLTTAPRRSISDGSSRDVEQDEAAEVDVQLNVEPLARDRVGRFVAVDTGVVDEEVNTVHCGQHVRRGGLGVPLLDEIRGDHHGLPRECRGQPSYVRCAAGDQHQACACGVEQPRAGLADAAAGAGHHSGLAAEVERDRFTRGESRHTWRCTYAVHSTMRSAQRRNVTVGPQDHGSHEPPVRSIEAGPKRCAGVRDPLVVEDQQIAE